MVSEIEWATKGDVTFANATCFEPFMIDQVTLLLIEHFKPGQVFILTTKELLNLPEEDFTLVGPFLRQMSWGETTIRAYIRK